MKLLIGVFLCIASLRLCAYTKEHIQVSITFRDQSLQLNHTYKLAGIQDVKIHTLKFYLGEFEFLKGQQVMKKNEGTYYLIDWSEADDSGMTIPLEKIPEGADHLTGLLGVDSSLEVQGVQRGALDPLKGMYWSWQSGYIHFKVEGVLTDSNGQKKDFQYHLGGYRSPWAVKKCLGIRRNGDCFILRFDIAPWLQEVLFNYPLHNMEPGMESKQLQELLIRTLNPS